MSHVDPDIVSSVLTIIDTKYGKFVKITITWGKIHKYLGMTIDSSSPGKVIFPMFGYIGNMLYDIPEDIKGVSATPASRHLVYIEEDETKLSWTNADLFCHFVAQLLYLSKIAHTDIHLVVSFLCTRVIDNNNEYYKNLTRSKHYLQGIFCLPLTLSIDKSGEIKWYVDAEFSVHKYMRSRNDGFVTMVTWGANVQSIKQKLNTKISIEYKLVILDDFLTQVIWTWYFLK